MTTDPRCESWTSCFFRVRVGAVNRFPKAWLALSDDGSLFFKTESVTRCCVSCSFRAVSGLCRLRLAKTASQMETFGHLPLAVTSVRLSTRNSVFHWIGCAIVVDWLLCWRVGRGVLFVFLLVPSMLLCSQVHCPDFSRIRITSGVANSTGATNYRTTQHTVGVTTPRRR